jgi:hypothetical protein
MRISLHAFVDAPTGFDSILESLRIALLLLVHVLHAHDLADVDSADPLPIPTVRLTIHGFTTRTIGDTR